MMIVTKDTNIKMTHSGVEIHSYEEAVNIGRKVLSAQKELDAILGSCLEYVKVYESHRYEEYLSTLNIKQNRAYALIAHSKLVKVAEQLNEPVPKEASKSQHLKGKTPEQKLDHYAQVQKETGKSEPSQSDIRNSFYSNKTNINKNYNSNKEKEIEIELEPAVDYEALYKETKEELKKTKAILKKRNAEIKKLKERLAQYEAFDLREFGYESNTALDAAKTFADMLRVMHFTLSSYMDKCRRIKNDKFNHGYMNHLSELKGHNPWAILGLPQTADLAEVKKRYRQLVKKLHPDFVEGKENEFNNVTIAYNIVRNHLT